MCAQRWISDENSWRIDLATSSKSTIVSFVPRAKIQMMDGTVAELEFADVSELIEWQRAFSAGSSNSGKASAGGAKRTKALIESRPGTKYGDADRPRMIAVLESMSPGAYRVLRHWADLKRTAAVAELADDSDARGVGAALGAANKIFKANNFRAVRKLQRDGKSYFQMGASQHRVMRDAFRDLESDEGVEPIGGDAED